MNERVKQVNRRVKNKGLKEWINQQKERYK